MSADKHAKTEAPTPKRKKEARRKGQVARTPDLSTWVTVLVATTVIPHVVVNAGRSLRHLEAGTMAVVANPDEHAALQLLGRGLGSVLTVVLPLAGSLALTAIVANLAQTRGAVATKKLAPSFSRINPVSGFKRVVSPMSAWEGAKSLLKVMVLALVGWRTLSGLVPHLIDSGGLPVGAVLGMTAGRALTFIRTAAAVGLTLGLLDYLLQYRKVRKSLLMSKQEIREEAKSNEGSPEIKAAIKRRQVRLSRLRMMADVARADAVIVNPTHFAVAVRYEAGRGAPRVVAKGVDALALRIRQEAEDHGVPVVEEPPLARTLYGACEIGQEIPPELFEAVARVLAFLFRLRAGGRVRPSVGGTLRLPAPALAGPSS